MSNANIHRAISFLIEAEMEMEGVDRKAELRIADVRKSLYALLGLVDRESETIGDDEDVSA